jgi:hypothetical protein
MPFEYMHGTIYAWNNICMEQYMHGTIYARIRKRKE